MKSIFLQFVFIFVLVIGLNAQNRLTDEQNQKILDRHNYYRQQQGAPNLQWSDKLAAEAQKWADLIAKKDQMIHSSMEWGENLYVSTNQVEPEAPVDLWATEEQYYNGEVISEDNYHLFGHYTQVIWSATTYVGCAEAVSKSGNHYWVCEYDPAGNYLDEKPVENYKKKKNND